jgi:DNA-binding transcriptional ArsR family regulator
MPASLAGEFTLGEDAALCIVADECRVRGSSDLSLDEIADKASVGRSAAKSALRKARELGLITVQNRGRLTNVVRIIAPEWLAWLQLGDGERRRLVDKADGHVRLQGPLFCSGNRSGLQRTRRGRAARRDPGG